LIDITYTDAPDRITITISDQGIPFNFLDSKLQAMKVLPMERQVGELGLVCAIVY
jgi:anti-sigma regulatory factor (Ser/Thr protein kinase)